MIVCHVSFVDAPFLNLETYLATSLEKSRPICFGWERWLVESMTLQMGE
jgi:hypothetical protein